MKNRDHLKGLSLWTVDHNEVWITGNSPEPDRQSSNFDSFGTGLRMFCQGLTRGEDGHFYAVCRIHVVCSNVAPNIIKVIEGAGGEQIRRGHLSGDEALSPSIAQDAHDFFRIQKLSLLRLGKTLCDLAG